MEPDKPPLGVPLDEEYSSLVLGGPLYQFLLRARLTTPALTLVHRRIAASILIAWLPLAVLAAVGGHLVGGVGVPFLLDLDAQAKFLLSVPMLIWAELFVHNRGKVILRQFIDSGLVAPEDQPRFEAILRGVWRIRNSVLVEVALLAVALTAGHWLWREQAALNIATWYAVPEDGSRQFTASGWWYIFVSMPVARFILLRWAFRLGLWYILMFRVARLPLRLNALHPDRAGGLGFLGGSVMAFIPILVAQTVLLAGVIGNQIWHEGKTLPEFKILIAGFIAMLMLAVMLPPGFFTIQMSRARRLGIRQFSLLAGRYADEFRRKWLSPGGAPGEELLGTGDIQSLADLGNSYEVVRQMRVLPFDPRLLARLAICLAIPLMPLVLTMIRLEDLINQAVKILL